MLKVVFSMGAAMVLALPVTALAAPDGFVEQGLANSQLGAKALESGDFAKAQSRLVAFQPEAVNDPARLINLGNAYAGMGRYKAARAAYDRALSAPDIMLVLANGSEESSRAIALRAAHRLDASFAMR